MKFNRNNPYEPAKPQGHEGICSEGRIAFSNAERSWEERFDLIEILENVLRENQLPGNRRNGWLVVNDDLYLRPEILSFTPLEPSGVRTVTTISLAHEKYFPGGLFEYQHASGDDMNASLTEGLNNWVEFDLPVFLDAISNSLETCTALKMEFPEPARRIRRCLLGPVYHLAGRDIEIEEEHSFCPCCLLTNSFEAFRQQFEGEDFYGIRLLVVRDKEGAVSAYCRVNGVDWEIGKEHLIKYGETWADRGIEMRKQYVAIYTLDANGA